jgi:hypothetical protein
MLDFIEFRAGQKQPMATYPFTERFLEQGAVLLLETNSRARRKSSNNSKKRLTGKVLS